jgi:hypothetical protein
MSGDNGYEPQQKVLDFRGGPVDGAMEIFDGGKAFRHRMVNGDWAHYYRVGLKADGHVLYQFAGYGETDKQKEKVEA